MSLPANDPYREPDPIISGYSISSTGAWGVNYDIRMITQISPTVAAATKVSRWYIENTGTGETWDPDLMHDASSGVSGYTMRSYVTFLLWENNSPLTRRVHVQNPIWYRLETPPNIALGIAHWWCGIAEADIDVDSFDATHAWADGNSFYRTVAFHAQTAIAILKELFEQTWQIYLYVNGAHQLACDRVPHTPSDTSDWTIDANNYIRVIRFGEIRDRKLPGKVKIFYDARQTPPGNPDFGIYRRDYSGASFIDKEQILADDYEAHYIDDVDDQGGFVNWTQYIICQIEVKGIGHLMDIGETFKLDIPSLAMSIDDEYPDNFVIHEIDLNFNNMSAIITGIKLKWWNIPLP